MYLQEYLTSVVAKERKDRFDKSDQLTLGEIISKCEAIKAKGYHNYDGQEPRVYFDFEYMKPTRLYSWRGSYEELALEFDAIHDAMTLSAFLDMLKEAVGKTYTGYKGGEFIMSRHTPVWVANYGNSGNTAVIEVVDNDCIVLLITGYRKY